MAGNHSSEACKPPPVDPVDPVEVVCVVMNMLSAQSSLLFQVEQQVN
jgi:hypothetical protein